MKVLKIIPVNLDIPPKILCMLSDFRAMANHCIIYAIRYRLTGPRFKYQIAKECRPWFQTHFGAKYASRYLHSAASFAEQHVKSWRKLGGDTTRLPHIDKPIARLHQQLVKMDRVERDRVRLRITLARRQWVYLDSDVHHRRFQEWAAGKFGELVIVPNGVRLCFCSEEVKSRVSETVGVDLNFRSAVIVSSDGVIDELDLSDVIKVQENCRRKRESIQRSVPRNLKRQRNLLRMLRKRESHRIEDRLHRKSNELSRKVGSRNIAFENLSTSTEDCLRRASGKRFKAKLFSWAHGKLQEFTARKHPYRTDEVYAFGTSSWCPFCGSKLVHPTWGRSHCGECERTYDRNRLSSVSILIRKLKPHRRSQPWSLARDAFSLGMVQDLQEQCTLHCSPMEEMPPWIGPNCRPDEGRAEPKTPVPGQVPGEALGLRGLSPVAMPGSVRPECAGPCPGVPKSDSGAAANSSAEQENRLEADAKGIVPIKGEPGYAAKLYVDSRG